MSFKHLQSKDDDLLETRCGIFNVVGLVSALNPAEEHSHVLYNFYFALVSYIFHSHQTLKYADHSHEIRI